MPKVANENRKRFSPEIRRSMILEQTAKLVAKDGIARLSMERIAQECGVSKALVYNYFDNLTELLSALLERELQALRKLQIKAAEDADTFEKLVRNITHQYLSYIDERGLLLERLQSEPSISKHADPTEYGRDAAVDYLSKIIAKHFELPKDIARATTDISFGLPAAAGAYLLRSDMDRQIIEDLTVSMIIGTAVSVKNDYLAKQQKLKR